MLLLSKVSAVGVNCLESHALQCLQIGPPPAQQHREQRTNLNVWERKLWKVRSRLKRCGWGGQRPERASRADPPSRTAAWSSASTSCPSCRCGARSRAKCARCARHRDAWPWSPAPTVSRTSGPLAHECTRIYYLWIFDYWMYCARVGAHQFCESELQRVVRTEHQKEFARYLIGEHIAERLLHHTRRLSQSLAFWSIRICWGLRDRTCGPIVGAIGAFCQWRLHHRAHQSIRLGSRALYRCAELRRRFRRRSLRIGALLRDALYRYRGGRRLLTVRGPDARVAENRSWSGDIRAIRAFWTLKTNEWGFERDNAPLTLPELLGALFAYFVLVSHYKLVLVVAVLTDQLRKMNAQCVNTYAEEN